MKHVEYIQSIKNEFEKRFALALNLHEIQSPLFIQDTALQDLSGKERVVKFTSNRKHFQVIQSAAKWKRMALGEYNYQLGEGIYLNMNAIRPDEKEDELHNILVDQWDWERVISNEQRTLDYLFATVNKIFRVIQDVGKDMFNKDIPNITFISSLSKSEIKNDLELEQCKKHKSIFLYGISQDRATDYDDWNLNGDILVWSDAVQKPIELSSMGIRVNAESLKNQLTLRNEEYKETSLYHSSILKDKLPLTIGGGIGQSRLVMYLTDETNIRNLIPY
jgi:aspartate--ammonia ligase